MANPAMYNTTPKNGSLTPKMGKNPKNWVFWEIFATLYLKSDSFMRKKFSTSLGYFGGVSTVNFFFGRLGPPGGAPGPPL